MFERLLGQLHHFVVRGKPQRDKLILVEPKNLRMPFGRSQRLEAETLAWCREILQHSPMALRCLKSALNADCDGQAGLQEMAGNATLLFYMSEEGQEGRNAYLEKRAPDFKRFTRHP